jgi:hypothetical protein
MLQQLNHFCFLTAFLFWLCIPFQAKSQVTWEFSFLPGYGIALPAPVTIQQSGENTKTFWTGWDTRSFDRPPYYSYRIGRYQDGKGWELEMNHLKIYARSLPSEVQHFEVTHGFNALWCNRAWRTGKQTWKFGGGVIIANPDTEVRGQKLEVGRGIFRSGYFIAGPTLLGAYSYRFISGKWWFLEAESKLSLAYATFPVAQGHARLPLLSVHLQIGGGLWIHQPAKKTTH